MESVVIAWVGARVRVAVRFRVRSGAWIRNRAKIKVKFMGGAGVQCLSTVKVWVSAVARSRTRDRFRLATCLVLQFFNTVPHAVVLLNHKVILVATS